MSDVSLGALTIQSTNLKFNRSRIGLGPEPYDALETLNNAPFQGAEFKHCSHFIGEKLLRDGRLWLPAVLVVHRQRQQPISSLYGGHKSLPPYRPPETHLHHNLSLSLDFSFEKYHQYSMSSKPSGAVNSLLHPDTSKTPERPDIFAAFAGIAWYNAVELIVLCFVSFKRRRGCYFWSLLIASSSILPNCLGYVLLFFPTGVSPYICVTLILSSWYGMITGQSMVLWSRLHLVLQNTKILRGVLYMIVVDAVLFHIPTTVLLYGTVAAPTSPWSRGYNTMEHIQLVGFCVQELIISGIYIWETVKLLRLRSQGRPHGILHQLLTINIIILCLDITIVVIEYVGYYAIQVMFKPMAYSIKLKLEYAILGKLVVIAQGAQVYNDDELPSCTREINSLPPSQQTPPSPGYASRVYSFSWFREKFCDSTFSSSGI